MDFGGLYLARRSVGLGALEGSYHAIHDYSVRKFLNSFSLSETLVELEFLVSRLGINPSRR
jgi:hypothetical protein